MEDRMRPYLCWDSSRQTQDDARKITASDPYAAAEEFARQEDWRTVEFRYAKHGGLVCVMNDSTVVTMAIEGRMEIVYTARTAA